MINGISPYVFEIAVLQQAKAWLNHAAEPHGYINSKDEVTPEQYELAEYHLLTDEPGIFKAALLLNKIEEQRDLDGQPPVPKIKHIYRLANECYDIFNKDVHWIIGDYQYRQQGLESIHVPKSTLIVKHIYRFRLVASHSASHGVEFSFLPLGDEDEPNFFVNPIGLFFYIEDLRQGLYRLFGSEITDTPLAKRHFLLGENNRNFDGLYADLVYQKVIEVDIDSTLAESNKDKLAKDFEDWLSKVKGIDFYDLYWKRDLSRYQQHLTVDVFREFQAYRSGNIYKEENEFIAALPTATEQQQQENKQQFSLAQIALIHVYRWLKITRINGKKIAQSHGYNSHNSGEKLYQKYLKFETVARRTIIKNPTNQQLKNRVNLFESILPHLDEKTAQRVKDEIRTLNANYRYL